jgi:bifunctional non-homologous end joining protein LigD
MSPAPGICHLRLDEFKASHVFGALLLGYYDDAGKMAYAGRCGSGYSDKEATDILRKLRPLDTKKMPIPVFPKDGRRFGKPLKPATTHWVKPKLVAEIQLRDLGERRHAAASFEGFRDDKPARKVT